MAKAKGERPPLMCRLFGHRRCLDDRIALGHGAIIWKFFCLRCDARWEERA